MSEVMQLESMVSIGITTRNRKNDLDETLDILISLSLNYLPLILYDDASSEPIASQTKLHLFSNLKILKNESCKGLIANRNRIVEITKTPYLISLDDDSCFSSMPPLEEAIEYLENHLSVAALEFFNININSLKKKEPPLSIYPVKSYTGCGHMLRCSTFLELGGYREYLFRQVEEYDWAQRAWQQSYEIHIFPSIVVHHRVSPIARWPNQRMFYQARNEILCKTLNSPLLSIPVEIFRTYLRLLFNKRAWRNPKLLWNLNLGFLTGFLLIPKHFHERKPMSWEQYIDYRQLP